MKKTLLSFLAAAAITAAVKIHPADEISIFAGSEKETVISWNFAGEPSSDENSKIYTLQRYFTIDNYIDNDIYDSFSVSFSKKEYRPDDGRGYGWNVFNIQSFHNTDDIWLNFEIGF